MCKIRYWEYIKSTGNEKGWIINIVKPHTLREQIGYLI
jgi:hypothetical protein